MLQSLGIPLTTNASRLQSRVCLREADAQPTDFSEESVGSLMDSQMPSGPNSTRSIEGSSAAGTSASDRKRLLQIVHGLAESPTLQGAAETPGIDVITLSRKCYKLD